MSMQILNITQLDSHESKSILTRMGHLTTPATCSEMVQGQFETGANSLAAFPTYVCSQVRVGVVNSSRRVDVVPNIQMKKELAVKRTLDFFGQSTDGARVLISSTLPQVKEMAASAPDIIAACRATAKASGYHLSDQEVSRTAISTEPSDSITNWRRRAEKMIAEIFVPARISSEHTSRCVVVCGNLIERKLV